MKNVIAGHAVLNSNSRYVAEALADAEMLQEFHTAIDTSSLTRLPLPKSLLDSLSKRSLPDALRGLVKTHPVPEVARLLARRFPMFRKKGIYAADGVLHAIDRAVSKRITSETGCVYAYEDSALASFRRAADLHIPRVYDLPIAYWRFADSILEAEASLQPDWAGTLTNAFVADAGERQDRKDAEIELATTIVVASSVTAKSLLSYPGALPPVQVIPYGAPQPDDSRRPRHTGVLRVLYVGSLTQRKGISYLFDAAAKMGSRIELTVVGRQTAQNTALSRALAQPNVEWIPALSHGAVLETMRSHDVLVFPSLVEGFGLVLTEALARGLPIITTPNTAGPDLITNGKEGWIVPIRDSEAIVEKLEQLVAEPDLLAEMGCAALARANELSWGEYKISTVKVLQEVA